MSIIKNNYRITFTSGLKIDYWGDFDFARRMYMDDIIFLRKEINKICQYSWFFFEPEVELTWMDDNIENCEKALSLVKKFVKEKNYKYTIKKPPERFVDWYKDSDKEEEFGGKIHHHCSNLVTEFWEYRREIGEGKGRRNQFRRTIHRICNPLALNFYDEGKICLVHGLRTLFLTLLLKMKFKDPLKWANKFGNLISGGY